MTQLLDHLGGLRSGGRKLLVPYLVAGIPDRIAFPAMLGALEADADAIEVGIPYSDPLMDGPVIAAAAAQALAGGTSPSAALDLVAGIGGRAPRVAMTYYNPIFAAGEDAYCRRAAESGITGLIVPDLPHEESASLRKAAGDRELAWIPLVAPTSPPARVATLAESATGFVYAVSTLGVTGAREHLSERAARVVEACREATDLPVLVGIGVSTPAQAREAAGAADGVVIGSAIVRRAMEEGPEAVATFMAEVRAELDAA